MPAWMVRLFLGLLLWLPVLLFLHQLCCFSGVVSFIWVYYDICTCYTWDYPHWGSLSWSWLFIIWLGNIDYEIRTEVPGGPRTESVPAGTGWRPEQVTCPPQESEGSSLAAALNAETCKLDVVPNQEGGWGVNRCGHFEEESWLAGGSRWEVPPCLWSKQKKSTAEVRTQQEDRVCSLEHEVVKWSLMMGRL